MVLIVPTPEFVQRANVTPFMPTHLFPSQINYKSESGEEMACIWGPLGPVTKCLAALYIGAENCLWLSSFRDSHCHFPVCCTSSEGEFLSCDGSYEVAAILWDLLIQHIKRMTSTWILYCCSFLIYCFSRTRYCQSEKEQIFLCIEKMSIFI